MKIATTLMICFSLISCGDFRGQPEPPQQQEEEKSERQYVGQIASIHMEQGFVLIRRSAGVTVSAGTILVGSGPGGRLTNLRVSGESLGQMLAADVQSGIPEVGDSVHLPQLEEEEEELEIPGVSVDAGS